MSKPAPVFLHPVTMESFFSTYWEKQPLHIRRESGGHEGLLDITDVESLLSSTEVFFPGVQLTQSGKAIEVSHYADAQNRILPLRLFELYSQGATIVLSQANKLFAPLNDLCRDVMRTMTMRCQTNVYLSPPGNQGFNAHYDTHDVFILQLSGAKTFNFYPSSVHLPCPDETFDPGALTSSKADESIELSAGDTLYIPRGIVHDAVADSAAPSIHVTLGVYPMLLRDMLQGVIQLASERDSRYRQSVDAFLMSSDADETLKDTLTFLLQEAADSFQDPEIYRRIQSDYHDALSLGALQDCQGLSDRRRASASAKKLPLAFETVSLRHELVINHERTPDGIKLRTFGQIVEFSAPMAMIVEKLLESGKVGVADFGAISTGQRDALIDRLLQENLVDID